MTQVIRDERKAEIRRLIEEFGLEEAKGWCEERLMVHVFVEVVIEIRRG